MDTQKSLSENEWFTKHLREEIANFISNPSGELLHISNQLYNRLLKTPDGDYFNSSFYSTVALNTSNYLPELERPASTLQAQN